MKNLILAFSLLVVSSNSFARLSDGKAHLKLKGSQIVGSVDQGFHFNKDAPAAVVIGDETVDAVKKDPKEFIFDASKAMKKSFAVNFYVCDDKNTVCESHEEKYQITGGKLVAMAAVGSSDKVAAKDAVKEPAKEIAEAPLKKNAHGFYQDSFNAALKLAAKEKKLLLVDFHAPWCPSCIRLDSEAFGEPVFQNATAKYIKISLNVDKVQLKEISKKYDVKAIPTIIVMNAKGEELTRILDFKPASVLVQELAKFQAGSKATMADLRKKAEAGDVTARKDLAEQAYAALKYDETVKWLTPLNEQSLLLANSEIRAGENANEDKKKSAELKKIYEKWIAVYPHSFDAIEWRPDFMRLIKGDSKEASAEVKKIGKENVAEIEAMLASDSARDAALAVSKMGDITGFEKAELLSMLVDSYKLMDETKKSDQAAALLAKEIATFKLSEKHPGQVLVASRYMKTANMKSERKAWMEKLVKAYPESDVYCRNMYRLYAEDKQFDQALPYAQKATELKSDSALYNMQNLASVYKELKLTKEASSTIEKALGMPEAKLESNKSTVTSLQELKKSL
jgi:thiol-disulfide isomerase/thioredoxin